MKNESKWVIIALSTKKALYGVGAKTLIFSNEEIAIEVGRQFFDDGSKFIVVEITS